MMTNMSQQMDNSGHGNEEFSKFLKQQKARSFFQKNNTSQAKSLDWQQKEELISKKPGSCRKLSHLHNKPLGTEARHRPAATDHMMPSVT